MQILPDIHLHGNEQFSNVSLVGEFKTGDLLLNSLNDFAEKNYCINELVSHLIAGNVDNTFITNGQHMLILELPKKPLVQRMRFNVSERHIGFRFLFFDEFSYLGSSKRGIKYNITSRMMFMSLAIKNHLTMKHSNDDTKMRENIKDLVMKIKLPTREIDRVRKDFIHFKIATMTKNIAMDRLFHFNNLHKVVKYFEIKHSFEYELLKLNLEKTALIIKPNKTELSKLGIRLSPNSPQASNFVLKIYDSSIITSQFSFSLSNEELFNNKFENFASDIYKKQFLKEIYCYQRINQYNDTCDDSNLKINIPNIYSFGPILTKDFQGFYIGMGMLDYDIPRTRYDINLGIEQIGRLYLLGIIHHDMRYPNFCFDRRSFKFYIYNFENSIISNEEEDNEEDDNRFENNKESILRDIQMLLIFTIRLLLLKIYIFKMILNIYNFKIK